MEGSGNPIAGFSSEKRARHRCSIPCRYWLSILGCIGFAVVYALRVNLSVALVAMINSTSSHSNLYKSDEEDRQLNISQKSTEEFVWNEQTQGIILGSFFYGYLITQIPGGWLATRFGGKHVFGVGVLCTSIFTLLTPWAAGQGVGVLVAVRVIEGIGEGVTFPAIQELFSSWAPPLERSTLYAIVLAGCNVGIILAQPISGILCVSSFLGGWPSVFYVFGSLGIVWYISWLLFVFDKPTTHPRISKEEKEYIVKAISSSQDKTIQKHPIPWLAIVKSPAVYAIVIAYFSSNWGYYTFLTALPSYFKDVLGFNILQDGVISSIPYAVGLLFSLAIAVFADWLISKRICTVTEVRKLATTAAFAIPACLLVATSYVGHEGKTFSIVLISLALGFGCFSSAGHSVNILDIAPRFAGIVMGIANGFGTVSGIVSPLVTGWLTNDMPTRHQWQKVLCISAVINVIGAISYLVLGSGEEQPWNTPEHELFQEVDIVREARTPLLRSPYDNSLQQHYQSINRV